MGVVNTNPPDEIEILRRKSAIQRSVTRPLNCPFKAPADCRDLDPVIRIATETAQEDRLLLDQHRPMVGANRRSQLAVSRRGRSQFV
jgi:hypothetical protein